MSGLFPPGPERARGTVVRVLFHSGTFAVLLVERGDGRREVWRGELGRALVGDAIEAELKRVRHPRFGWQYEVESFQLSRPEDPQGLSRYVAENVRGVGPKTAERLVQALGRAVLAGPSAQRLQEALGVTKARAERLAGLLAPLAEVSRGEQELELFLASIGLSRRAARALFARWGGNLAQVLAEDPYQLVGAVAGLGFRRVDAFAQARGVAKDDPRRRRAAVLHALSQAEQEGDVYLTAGRLASALKAWEVLDVRADLQELTAAGVVVLEGDRLYRAEAWQAEVAVARALAERLGGQGPPGEVPLAIITGGPGTGKTTLVRRLVGAARAKGWRVALAAPSGRAARRLEEASGHPAATLHRLLRIGPGGRPADGWHLEAELVVVDEASMCDLFLLRALLDCLPADSRLVLVGDPDQLPPVGPGQPFRSLLQTGLVPTVALTEVHRQERAPAQGGEVAVLRRRRPPPGGGRRRRGVDPPRAPLARGALEHGGPAGLAGAGSRPSRPGRGRSLEPRAPGAAQPWRWPLARG